MTISSGWDRIRMPRRELYHSGLPYTREIAESQQFRNWSALERPRPISGLGWASFPVGEPRRVVLGPLSRGGTGPRPAAGRSLPATPAQAIDQGASPTPPPGPTRPTAPAPAAPTTAPGP